MSDLSDDAIHEIRQRLIACKEIPIAPFIDDHVGNAIAMYLRERDKVAELLAELENIANNRLSVDMPPEEKPEHDYAQGWDALVMIARAAIAKARG